MRSKKMIYTSLFFGMAAALAAAGVTSGGAMLGCLAAAAVSGFSYCGYAFYRERKDSRIEQEQVRRSYVRREQERLTRHREYARKYQWVQESYREQAARTERQAKTLDACEIQMPAAFLNRQRGRNFD